VGADQSASDALIAADIKLDIKCADGICGVCKCKLLSGKAEHRDFVLSAHQRETEIILCQSRAADPNGVLEIEL
jgi:ferredoxin